MIPSLLISILEIKVAKNKPWIIDFSLRGVWLPLSLTGSASCTDLSQLANGIWEIHAGCPSFLRVSSVAKIGYIPQFKTSNARDQDEVSSDLARMVWLPVFPILIRAGVIVICNRNQL